MSHKMGESKWLYKATAEFKCTVEARYQYDSICKMWFTDTLVDVNQYLHLSELKALRDILSTAIAQYEAIKLPEGEVVDGLGWADGKVEVQERFAGELLSEEK